MRKLIISNTHYQTIVAIQLKMTLFKADQVVLLISDHSKGSEEIANRLAQTGIFEKVCFFRSREIVYNYTKKQQWQDYFAIAFKASSRYSYYLDGLDNLRFDELLVYNYEPDIYGLYNELYRYNKDIIISMFEEGVLSYNIEERTSAKLRAASGIRRIRGKKSVYEARGNFYCFFPQLYTGSFFPTEIPRITKDSPTTQILTQAFGIQADKLSYEKKYIYFSSVYDFEGGKPIGEFELVKQLVDVVGKENLLIKTHPRDRRTVYEEYGLSIDTNSSAPWEAIQLCYDFSGKVFLSATSSSLLAGSLMSDQPIEAYYLFCMCDLRENYAEKTVSQIQRVLNHPKTKEIFSNIHVPENISEIV